MKLIITGATGMVGEGVLIEALKSPQMDKVLVISRKKIGMVHEKLEQLLLSDFFEIGSQLNGLSGYDACCFCLGVSSVGMKEADYRRLTYDLTLNFAQAILPNNPKMTFMYISGSATDSTEKGKMMWARVKGKTENDLMQLGFKDCYCFRPGYLQPTPGQKNKLFFYKWIGWMYPLFETIARKYVSRLSELGVAMLYVAEHGYNRKVIEVNDIHLINEKLKNEK